MVFQSYALFPNMSVRENVGYGFRLKELARQEREARVTDYINRMRLSLARELLTGTRLDIESVAERSGFSSTRQFRRARGRLHDLPPSRMRELG